MTESKAIQDINGDVSAKGPIRNDAPAGASDHVRNAANKFAASHRARESVKLKATIFERYGGFAQVSRVVSGLYDKILESPQLTPYFANTDMRRLIDHQTRFIATLLGGPASYSDEHLQRVHARLGITDAAFAEMVFLLKETLEDFGFEDEDIETVEFEITSRKHCIVAGN